MLLIGDAFSKAAYISLYTATQAEGHSELDSFWRRETTGMRVRSSIGLYEAPSSLQPDSIPRADGQCITLFGSELFVISRMIQPLS
jgi:hypothetical protein